MSPLTHRESESVQRMKYCEFSAKYKKEKVCKRSSTIGQMLSDTTILSEKDFRRCFNAGVFQCIGLVTRHASADKALPTETRNIGNSLDGGTVNTIRVLSKTGRDHTASTAFQIVHGIHALPRIFPSDNGACGHPSVAL